MVLPSPTEQQVVVDRALRAVGCPGRPDAVDSAYLDDLRARLGFTADVVLLLDGERGREHLRPDDRPVRRSRIWWLPHPPTVEWSATDGITAAVLPAGPGHAVRPSSWRRRLLAAACSCRPSFLVALVSLVVAVVAAVAIARDLTGPLEEVTDAAEAVASGDLTKSIEVRRSDEVGRLARAFNHMTDELLTYVTELEGSRDALTANFDRLGDALSATLDLDTLVPVVLETAMTSVGAEAGARACSATSTVGSPLHAEHGMRTRSLAVPSAVVVGRGAARRRRGVRA